MRKYPGIVAIAFLSLALLFSMKNPRNGNQFTVAVVNGTIFEEIAWDYPRVSEVRFFDDDRQSFQELVEGRVDAVVTDRLAGLFHIKEGGHEGIRLAGNILSWNRSMVIFKKEDGALRQAFNNELSNMLTDGTLAEISTKYFGSDILAGITLPTTHQEEPIANDYSWQRIKRKRRIMFAVTPGIKPLRYLSKKKQIVGFDVEVAQIICRRLGVRFNTVVVSPDDAFTGLKINKYDGVLGIINIPEEQMEEVDYSDPYYISGPQFFVVKGSSITSPEMLEEAK